MRFAPTKAAVLTTLLSGINSVLDVSGSSFFIVEEEHQRLKGYLGQPPEHWPNIEKIVISLNEPVYCAEVINTKQPRVVPEAEKDPKMVAWLVRYYNCKAALIWPVFVGEKAIGCVVAAETKQPRSFKKNEI
jgi:putative methionine-R-sulfoxide reductase with GAF domain